MATLKDMSIKTEKKVNAFISHRCKDYNDQPWRTTFENYLESYRINPVYGCSLETVIKGDLEDYIKLAMNKCNIYIAVKTKLWGNADKEGWPAQEYEFWKEETKGYIERYRNSIGFLINISDRNTIPVLKNLYTYHMRILKFEDLGYPNKSKGFEQIYSKGTYSLNINPRYVKKIPALFTDLVRTAQRQEEIRKIT